ncbi:hypothetical protein ACFPTY_19090 [Halomonas beimenensis]|uniref:Uncharacterized protein n=1 Tax=Halomonas beimenensis TaxID=475662 RepID=A0A291P355_9GAMM|nr:hypothetical protein [Halomonas beimenensis]ATJ81326.1 hypothetical protein BEI_0339 [Halomonas beimenensis]
MDDALLPADALDTGTLYRLFSGSIAPRPVGRIAGTDYARGTDRFALERPA